MKVLKYPSGIKYIAVSSKEINELVKSNKISYNKEEWNFIDEKGVRYDVEKIKLSEIPIGDKWIDPDSTKYERISETEFLVIDSIFTEEDELTPYSRVIGEKIPISYFLTDNSGKKLRERTLTLHNKGVWYLE